MKKIVTSNDAAGELLREMKFHDAYAMLAEQAGKRELTWPERFRMGICALMQGRSGEFFEIYRQASERRGGNSEFRREFLKYSAIAAGLGFCLAGGGCDVADIDDKGSVWQKARYEEIVVSKYGTAPTVPPEYTAKYGTVPPPLKRP